MSSSVVSSVDQEVTLLKAALEELKGVLAGILLSMMTGICFCSPILSALFSRQIPTDAKMMTAIRGTDDAHTTQPAHPILVPSALRVIKA